MKKTIVALLTCMSLAFGAQGDYKSELTVNVGGVKPEGNLDLEDKLNLGLRFGTYVEDKFFDIVEVGFDRASKVKYDLINQKTDINRFYVNLIKEYDLTKDTALYGLAGIGYENYRNPQLDNDDDGFFNYGVGIKHWITDQFALKAEARHAINFSRDNNLLYSIGFVIPFGKRAQEVEEEPAPVVKPVPAPVMKKPVKAMVELDSDKDGVLDKDDVCPQSPMGVEVKANGCEKDDDNDGVVNSMDKCPTTPAGKVVGENGCMKIVRLHVNFDTNKAEISQMYMSKIKEVAEFLADNKDYKVVLEGHTDSRGSQKYNQMLSEKRANSVKQALVSLGVDASRISAVGYGETKPIASNKTKEGMAQNRRVDASFEE
ncbi:OmpA family protein [Sulfurospirillum sp. 1307]|jgi:OOP family OmpA-OmpF porin